MPEFIHSIQDIRLAIYDELIAFKLSGHLSSRASDEFANRIDMIIRSAQTGIPLPAKSRRFFDAIRRRSYRGF